MFKKILFSFCLLSIQFWIIYTQNTNQIADKCELKKASTREKSLLQKLQNLAISKQFTVEDDEHKYSIGICTRTNSTSSNLTDIAVIQTNKQSGKQFVIGRLDNVDLEGSDEYVRLTYNNGDPYNNACGKSNRSAVITILCNRYNSAEEFSLLEENNERGDKDNGYDCAYVFQLLTPSMCTTRSTTVATTTSSTKNTTSNIVTTTSIKSTTETTSTQPNKSNSTSTAMSSNQTTAIPKPQAGSKLGVFPILIIMYYSLNNCDFC